jgi:hypothetical protein
MKCGAFVARLYDITFLNRYLPYFGYVRPGPAIYPGSLARPFYAAQTTYREETATASMHWRDERGFLAAHWK